MKVRLITRIGFLFGIIMIVLLSILPIYIKVGLIIRFLYVVFLLIIMGSGWNLIAGYTGQISLANAAFFGLGAYATVILAILGIPTILGMMVGAILASAFAILISPTFRLRGAYFAVGSWFLTEALRVMMLNWNDVTGGAMGLSIPLVMASSLTTSYYTSFVLMIISIGTVFLISRSRIGLILRSIKEDEEAAQTMGINTLKFKILVFALSSSFIAIAGSLFVSNLTFVEPYSIFSFDWTIKGILAASLGGAGSWYAPIIGAFILQSLIEITIPIGGFHPIIYAALLIVIIFRSPSEIIGLARGKLPSNLKWFPKALTKLYYYFKSSNSNS